MEKNTTTKITPDQKENGTAINITENQSAPNPATKNSQIPLTQQKDQEINPKTTPPTTPNPARPYYFKYIYLLPIALALVFIATVVIYFYHVYTTGPSDKTQVDTLSKIISTNTNFKKAEQLQEEGKMDEAVSVLQEAQAATNNPEEKAVLQFNVAAAKLSAQDRYGAIKEFTNLANDTSLPKRTRALAMNQIYLYYRGYGDTQILQTAFDKDISTMKKEDAEYEYMRQAYTLWPFAMSAVTLGVYEIKAAKDDKEKIKQIYDTYSLAIEKSITEMSYYSGERTYIANARLGKAKMEELLIPLGIISTEEVKKSFEDAVKVAQQYNQKGTLQFILLNYANFEASLSEFEVADKILGLLQVPIPSMLIENLSNPSSKEMYPGLDELKKQTSSATTTAFFTAVKW